jgi:hypothetical protein
MMADVNAALLCAAVFPNAPTPQPSNPSAATVAALVRDLGSDTFLVRERATKQLADVGAPAIWPLREALTLSQDAEVRSRARQALGIILSSTPYLIGCLEDPAGRIHALNRIEEHALDDRALVPALMRVLKDRDEAVRDAAIGALLRINPDLPELASAAPRKASVDGKYRQLVRRLRVPQDRDQYGDYQDYGYFEHTTGYAGHPGPIKGYWVWVSPCWYVWGALK